MENTNKTVKVTKKDRFAQLMALVQAQETVNMDLVDFINHEVELLAKKNSKSGKPTKAQIANEGLRETIFSALQNAGKPVTVTQLLTTPELSAIEGLSNQKVSALLKQLVDADRVVRTQVKKSAFYSVKVETEENEVETEESEESEVETEEIGE